MMPAKGDRDDGSKDGTGSAWSVAGANASLALRAAIFNETLLRLLAVRRSASLGGMKVMDATKCRTRLPRMRGHYVAEDGRQRHRGVGSVARRTDDEDGGTGGRPREAGAFRAAGEAAPRVDSGVGPFDRRGAGGLRLRQRRPEGALAERGAEVVTPPKSNRKKGVATPFFFALRQKASRRPHEAHERNNLARADGKDATERLAGCVKSATRQAKGLLVARWWLRCQEAKPPQES